MSRRPADDKLRQWLRDGDPLPPGEELPRQTAICMRQVVLAAEPPPAWPLWRLAAAAAVLAVALAAALLFRLAAGPDLDATRIATHPSQAVTSKTAARTPKPPDRQIQFVTRGGTRVIWTLKPRIDS